MMNTTFEMQDTYHHFSNKKVMSPSSSTVERTPHSDVGTNGQYNDEYDDDAHQKMNIRHYVQPRKNRVAWNSTPIIHNLPGSCDDEFHDYGIFTTVDLSMVRNASRNALEALVSKDHDSECEVTTDNCLRSLECTAQQYAWGKIGSNALVSRLKAAQTKSYQIDETAPYAELWLGTHPNGMSHIQLPSDADHMMDGDASAQTIPLVQYVQQNPQMHLGVDGITGPSEDFDLTFLFKVLSIEKVLSIQAHPDKFLAAQLHTDKPSVYKDPNHKPEMAIALTDDFEAMSGFRPMTDIASNLLEYKELGVILGKTLVHMSLDAAESFNRELHKSILRTMFRTYMEAEDEIVQKQLNLLMERLSNKTDPTTLDKLILKLAHQFPGDSGIFAPIIFNHMKLKKGDAFYIGANEPHAYIQGEILECMACSDNVVRAGLTPKMKDVETLVKMLTYKSTLPEITRGKKVDPYTKLYVPPVKDFAIEVIEVPAGERHIMKDVRSPSILLTLDGSGILQQGSVQSMNVSFGKAAFMSANTTATVIANESGPGLKVVRALSNVHL